MSGKFLYFNTTSELGIRSYLRSLGIPFKKIEGRTDGNGRIIAQVKYEKTILDLWFMATYVFLGGVYRVVNTPVAMSFLFAIGAIDIREDN